MMQIGGIVFECLAKMKVFLSDLAVLWQVGNEVSIARIKVAVTDLL